MPRVLLVHYTTPPVVAFASARQDPTEIDRALQLQSKGNVAAMDQPQVLTDLIDDTTGTTTQAVQSKIKLATLDDGAPFGRKVWKRLRAIARADQTTVIGVSVSADNGAQTMADSLAIEAMGGQIWDVTWDVTWSGGVFAEVESIFDEDQLRRPARTLEIELTHGDAVGLSLHDVEVRYAPVPRPVA